MAERTDSRRLFQREGAHELKALAPVLVLILGMDRVIPVFDLSEREERWQSRSEGKRAICHEEPCRSASRSLNGLYILLVANEGSAAVEHCE